MFKTRRRSLKKKLVVLHTDRTAQDQPIISIAKSVAGKQEVLGA
jgi:hypothetical protein